MTTTNVQPTKGPVTIRPHPDTSCCIPSVMAEGDNGYPIEVCTLWASACPGGPDECMANANLIKDAFNTHTLTGLTPSELVKTLRAAISDFEELARMTNGRKYYYNANSVSVIVDKLRAALTKSAGGGQ